MPFADRSTSYFLYSYSSSFEVMELPSINKLNYLS
jgi:hypothetical protein